MKSLRCRFGFHDAQPLMYREVCDWALQGFWWRPILLCVRCDAGRPRDDIAYFTEEDLENINLGMTGANAR